jgi:hypothetical protein
MGKIGQREEEIAAEGPDFEFVDSFSVALLAQHVILAGISNALGQTSSHPLDLLKIRLQVQGAGQRGMNKQYAGIVSGLMHIVRTEGVRGCYKGWQAAVLREFSYSGLRVGLYEPVKNLFGAKDPAHTPLYLKVASGACSGMVGAAVANPFDLLKVPPFICARSPDPFSIVYIDWIFDFNELAPLCSPPLQVRFQAAENAQAYKELGSAFQAMRDVARADGFAGLWRGVGPTVVRGMLITGSQVPAYDHIKHTVLNNEWAPEGRGLHFGSSFAASLVAVTVSNSVDVVKTRVMNQRQAYSAASAAEVLAYQGPLDCAAKIFRTEGPLAFYKGWLAAWLRLGPHTIVTFMVFEELRLATGINPL